MVDGVNAEEAEVHAVACVGFGRLLLKGIAHSLVEHIEDGGWREVGVVGDDVGEEQGADDGEEGARDTVARTVDDGDVGDVAV